MATNRKRTPRSRKITSCDLTPALLHYFQHGHPLDHSLEGWPECLGPIFFDRDKLLAIWHEHREQIIADWTKDHPGTTPYMSGRHDQ